MKEAEGDNNYTIDINKQEYTFSCSDGEQHVVEIEKTLRKVIDLLSSQEPGHILSDYAMKIALLLADETVRKRFSLQKLENETTEKTQPLIFELNRVLGVEE